VWVETYTPKVCWSDPNATYLVDGMRTKLGRCKQAKGLLQSKRRGAHGLVISAVETSFMDACSPGGDPVAGHYAIDQGLKVCCMVLQSSALCTVLFCASVVRVVVSVVWRPGACLHARDAGQSHTI
jgi:hypothetical protein